MHLLAISPPPKFLEVPVEALVLGEERGVGEIPVEHTHRVVRIYGRDEAVAGVAYRPKMPGRYVAGYAGEGEVHGRGRGKGEEGRKHMFSGTALLFREYYDDG